VSGGGWSSHASVAGAGACANAVQPDNPNDCQNADRSDRKHVLSRHDPTFLPRRLGRVAVGIRVQQIFVCAANEIFTEGDC
jgi:hypothetical protein